MRIGGYEVIALLGAGGMGEVYRARDTRLGRDVALKTIGPGIAADADAVARFEREARALASLNHPNIAAIHDVVEHNGQPVLVLEIVEGDTLADRIAIKPIAIRAAVESAKQIADALDAAHEAGIVHRDLKPANIKITDSGQVKVLDFGLAKAAAVAAGHDSDIDPAQSPTISVHGTRAGVILGTAAYMSPEQARGKRIDKRTDIWAFGCVLFEMLTGKRAFTGETTSDVIAAIIERPANLALLPTSTPPSLRRVITRCLEKDPKLRARDIADVRVELEDDTPGRSVVERRRVLSTAVSLLAVAVIAAGGVAVWRWPKAAAAVPFEFTFTAPPQFTLVAQRAATSPDGRLIAFLARDQRDVPSLWIRAVDNPTLRRLDGTNGIASPPAWSPDSRNLAYFVGGVWKRTGIDGGPALTIASNVPNNLGASWGRDNLLLTAPANRTSLARLLVTGGTLQEVTALDAEKENSHRYPQLLPDGRHFLFTVRSDSLDRLGIKIGSLDSKEVRTLVNVASQGVYTDPGWLLYATPDEVLMAQRLDPSSWALQGSAQPVVGPVSYNGPSFTGGFDASSDGRILTYIAAASSRPSLEWFDRGGAPLGRLGPEQVYRGVRLSADGHRVAVELADPQIGTRDLWIIDATTQALSRLTTHPATDWRAQFSPDGETVAFASDRSGVSSIFLSPTNRAGAESPFYRSPTGGVFPWGWTRDGKSVLAAVDDRQGRPTQLVMVPAAGGTATVLADSPDGFGNPRFSPSRDLVAFVSRGSSDNDIFVASLRDQHRVRVSTNGGTNPAWGSSDHELFYQTPRGEIMHAALSGTTMTAPPQLLFRPCESMNRTFARGGAEVSYDVTADGTRFLAVCDPPDAAPAAINVIVNWQSKLK